MTVLPDQLPSRIAVDANESDWHRSLANAIRNPDELIDLLELSDEWKEPARMASELFPLLVPHSFLKRMQPGNPRDPLLLQVLPLGVEQAVTPGFVDDAVLDHESRRAPGLLQKYSGRVLMMAAGACAVHCRYCFRRHFPYGDEPRRLQDWTPAFDEIRRDESLREVILSGGDPLMLTDSRLEVLCGTLAEIPHLRRLRVHTRLPIVLPNRVTPRLIRLLTTSPLTPIVVVHANHPNEIVGDCSESLRSLVRAGMTVLNQSVLLRGINDNADALAELSERLVDVGVVPYYLHQLDRVSGAAHFEVPEETGRALIEQLRSRLPGYAVPQYVREVAGEPFKKPL